MKTQRSLTPGIHRSIARIRPKSSIQWAILAAAPVACCLTSSAFAQLQWDASGTATSLGTATDGGGFWDASNSLSNPDNNWFNGTNDSVWVNGDSTTFGNAANNSASGAAGTVTIDDASGGITASSITFIPAGSGNYTIGAIPGDSLTLTGTPGITLSGAVNPTISAPIAGTTGLVVAGNGNTVTLSGAETYTGNTTIESTAGSVPAGVNLVLATGAALGTAAGTIDVGFNNNATGGGNLDTSALTMTGTTSLTAGTLNIDVLGHAFSAGTSNGNTLTVSGTNTINTDTITIDSGAHSSTTKGGDGALILSSGATLTLDGSAGTGPVTLLDISDYNYETGGGTTATILGNVDFSQGTVNGTITTVTVATGKAGSSTAADRLSSSFGSLEFASGALGITTLNVGDVGSQASSGTVTLEAGGTGTLTIGAGGLNFANNGIKVPAGVSAFGGTVNVNGATLNLQGPVVNVNPTGSANIAGSTTTAIVNVNGGVLNANGNPIGTAAAPVILNATAGTLANIGLVNGTGGVTMSGTGSLLLTGTNTYTGGTNVSSGTLVVSTPGALPLGAINVTGGTLQLAPSTGLATISSLAISGNGTFDVSNNHVIINYGDVANDPIASIAALLATGYNGGSWNGVGGIVTSAPIVNGGLTYGLGYADAADPQDMATGLASGTIEIKYTLLGDADMNGIVNGLDFGILAANFNKGITGWDEGDFDYNNIVNGLDFGDLAANFNKGAAGTDAVAALDAFAVANGLLADVPEPASAGLLLLAASAAVVRRRRKPAID